MRNAGAQTHACVPDLRREQGAIVALVVPPEGPLASSRPTPQRAGDDHAMTSKPTPDELALAPVCPCVKRWRTNTRISLPLWRSPRRPALRDAVDAEGGADGRGGGVRA